MTKALWTNFQFTACYLVILDLNSCFLIVRKAINLKAEKTSIICWDLIWSFRTRLFLVRNYLKLKVPLFILDNPISYLSCSPWRSSKGPPHGSSVTTGGIRSTRRIPAMLGRLKLDNTLLTCDQGNFNEITARSRNRNSGERHVHYHCATSTPHHVGLL